MQLNLRPEIHQFKSFFDFSRTFELNCCDLIITNEFIYEPYMRPFGITCRYLFQERYGIGEPTNIMIDRIIEDLELLDYNRIIAVGGGTIIDIAKILALKGIKKSIQVFNREVPLEKSKSLIIIPTTCGTGSEVTNISIAEIKEEQIKRGVADDALYADHCVLIPELLNSLPYTFFISSSIDALIHAVESYLSPKSNQYTELFSISAMEKILSGYLKIVENGIDHRFELSEDFLIASNFAGIAFGNTGVGAVHALSYPLGGRYHVPHGEANYRLFIEVLRTYSKLKPEGKIKELECILSSVLKSRNQKEIYNNMESFLNKLLPKKRLSEYGMEEEEAEIFTDSVIEKQQRLLANNYVPFSRETILRIYQTLY